MKILLTNHQMNLFGGTENYTAALAMELSKNHEVTIFTFVPGQSAKHYMQYGLKFVASISGAEQYDLILVNHTSCWEAVKDLPGKKIFTSHGPLSELEKMPDGADAYVAVSEEISVQNAEKKPIIIRNSFGDIDPVRYRMAGGTCIINYYAEVPGLEKYRIYCEKSKHPEHMWDILTRYEVICASGRTLVEAALHGKKVVALSQYGLGGAITVDNYSTLQRDNFTGRKQRSLYTLDYEIKKAKENPSMRDVFVKQRGIEKAVKQYLEVYKCLIQQ